MSNLFWELNRASLRLAGRAMRFGASAARAGASAAAVRSAARLPGGVRSRGVLCPGDPSPPPGVDLLDYRGIAEYPQVAGLAGFEPRLGRFLDCRRGQLGPPLGLPMHLLLRHTAVIGPSGSGKTTSVVVPWIVSLLRQGCSVATIDVRGDLLQAIKAHTARTGGPTGSRLWLWDYSAGRSHRWNWLWEANDLRTVEMAVTSIIGRPRDNDPQPHFYHRDYRWLRALVMLAKHVHGRAAEPRHIVELVNDQRALGGVLQGVHGFQPAADLADLAAMHPDDYSRALAGLTNAVSIFGLPRVVQVTDVSDFELAAACDQPTLLVAVAPLADGRLGEILSSIFASQLILRVFARFKQGGIARPLFLVIDEAPRLKDRVNFEELLAIARGGSVGVCLAAQDVTQFGDLDTRTAILANCHTLIMLPGTSPETAGFLSKRLGDRLVEQRSVTRSNTGSLFGSTTVGRNVTTAPVLGLREIMHPPFGDHVAIAHVPSVARQPFLVDVTI